MLLRKNIMLGILIGSCASVPIIHQQNPDFFENVVRMAVSTNQPAPAQPDPTVLMARAEEPEPLGKKVRLQPDARGHYYGDFKMNGQPVAAMVDTGATLVALNRSTARKVGIKLDQSDFKFKVDTANGTAKAAAATISSMQIGKIYVTDVQAVVLEDGALSSTLVGMTFLKRLQRFQIEKNGLTLEQ